MSAFVVKCNAKLLVLLTSKSFYGNIFVIMSMSDDFSFCKRLRFGTKKRPKDLFPVSFGFIKMFLSEKR